MTVHFAGADSKMQWRDSTGRVVRERRVLPEEYARWNIFESRPEVVPSRAIETHRRGPVSEETDEDHCTSASIAASTPDVRLMLLTSSALSPWRTGYLVPACHSSDKVWHALRVELVEADGEKKLQLAAGFVCRHVLEVQSREVVTKQTARQNWLSLLWRRVEQRLVLSFPHVPEGCDFTPIQSLVEIDGTEGWRLACMLLCDHWLSAGASISWKRADIAELGFPASTSDGAFDKLFKGLELQCAVNRLFDPQ